MTWCLWHELYLFSNNPCRCNLLPLFHLVSKTPHKTCPIRSLIFVFVFFFFAILYRSLPFCPTNLLKGSHDIRDSCGHDHVHGGHFRGGCWHYDPSLFISISCSFTIKILLILFQSHYIRSSSKYICPVTSLPVPIFSIRYVTILDQRPRCVHLDMPSSIL